jgi:16S rRNA (guanine(966)-N(2))-methyltransferase RsmD
VRVIAGKFRGRKLLPSGALDLRPTSDRLRETLFDVIAAAGGLDGARWLDLYAGTGAVGIEALSRGASYVCFVESARAAAALIKRNLDSLNIANCVTVIQKPVLKALDELDAKIRNGSEFGFDFCFLDPPYRLEAEYERAIMHLAKSSVLSTHALLVAEHSKHFDLAAVAGTWSRVRRLQQGDAVLSFYRKS